MSDHRTGVGRAEAFANIALVKYWGKRNIPLNLPCTGSLSLTLAPLRTDTTVRFDPTLDHDIVHLNNTLADPRATRRVTTFLDLLRSRAEVTTHARVDSVNHFPTAAGLASSASAFAALAVATDAALGLDLNPTTLSMLARQGSGSAARSLFGGYAEMRAGQREDGTDAHAVPLFDVDHWPLHVVIALVTQEKKKIASTDGMESTRTTSPYFGPWCDHVDADLDAARHAIAQRDFEHLARVAERSCMRMHASAMAADPAVLYWLGPTVTMIHAVRAWRREGLAVFFTIDAGPNVKVFCPPDLVDEVTARVRDVPGIGGTLHCTPGAGARILEVNS